MLQETLLAAWRGLGQYEGRAGLRTWLYRIATNRCLNALRDSGRRPRPEPPEPPFERPSRPAAASRSGSSRTRTRLLDGLPDAAVGPDAVYEAKETIALAFVAAVQHLPPRQRAVLLLRDALGFRSPEVAGMLDSSEASVNSALQRARATMTAALPARDRDRAALPRSAEGAGTGAAVRGRVRRRRRRRRGGAAHRRRLVQHAARQPRVPGSGRDRELPDAAAPATAAAGGSTLIPTRANGQPAFGCYVPDYHAADLAPARNPGADDGGRPDFARSPGSSTAAWRRTSACRARYRARAGIRREDQIRFSRTDAWLRGSAPRPATAGRRTEPMTDRWREADSEQVVR